MSEHKPWWKHQAIPLLTGDCLASGQPSTPWHHCFLSAQMDHHCRQDNGLLWILPPDGSFDYGISWIRGGWYLMMKSRFLWSKWCYIYIHTYTGGQDPEVASSLFTYFDFLSSSSYGMIYMSLESHFHVEYKASEIVGIGSVVMEKFTYQFTDMCVLGNSRGECIRIILDGFLAIS